MLSITALFIAPLVAFGYPQLAARTITNLPANAKWDYQVALPLPSRNLY